MNNPEINNQNNEGNEADHDRNVKNLTEKKETKKEQEFQVAFSFIKPIFTGEFLEIKKILEKNGLLIIYSDKIKLTPEQVDTIYQDNIKHHFYEAMKKYLSNNEVVALLIGGKDVDVQKTLMELKKKGNKDGEIRKKFGKEVRISQEEIEIWKEEKHPKQDEISIILTQTNVVHVPDTIEEAKENIKSIFGHKLHSLKIRGNLPSELYKLLE